MQFIYVYNFIHTGVFNILSTSLFCLHSHVEMYCLRIIHLKTLKLQTLEKAQLHPSIGIKIANSIECFSETFGMLIITEKILFQRN